MIESQQEQVEAGAGGPVQQGAAEESFGDMIRDSLEQLNTSSGHILTGVITELDEEVVSVHVNLKSEGVIPRSEFDEDDDVRLEPGEPVKVALETIDDGSGATVLSREKARRYSAWSEMEQAYKTGEAVDGYLRSRVKGGFSVEIGSVRAFLPGSLVDVRPMQEATHLEGEKLQFRIIKLDPERNNVVVSRRAVLLESMNEDKDSLLANLEEGQEYDGLVKNLMAYGAFVDLGGVDGLLHNTDISWKRINHPSEVLAAGDKIRVKVLKFSRADMRISLGMKQLQEDPWKKSGEKYPPKSIHEGVVTGIRDYGCFVELKDSIEGLVHASEMDWSNRKIDPSDHVAVGDTVEVMVLEVDYDRRRVSLGMKQCRRNPWKEFSEQNPPGSHVEGAVTHISNFGLFVALSSGLDSLVHISDIAWDRGGDAVIKDYSKGDEVKAVVLSVDVDRERISLGIKQLESNPMDSFAKKYAKGDRLEVPVMQVDAEEIFVQLDSSLRTRMLAKDVTEDRSVDDLRQVVKVGDKLEVQIINMDLGRGRVIVSATAAERGEQREALREHRAQVQQQKGVTLGDVLDNRADDSADSAEGGAD